MNNLHIKVYTSFIIYSLFLLLTACSSEEDLPFSWQNRNGDSILVKLNRHPYSEAVIKRIPDFEALTGIKVNYTVVREDSYYQDLFNSMESRKTRPDVFMTGAYHAWGLASEGIIEDLDSYLNSPSLTAGSYEAEDFFSSIISSLRWKSGATSLGEGPLLALPMGFELNTIAYNTRIFSEQGLNPPETYDDLLELAEQLNHFNGPDSYAIALRGTRDWSSIHTAYMTAYTAFGAKDFTSGKNGILESAVNSPESEALNRYWIRLVQTGATRSRETQSWYEIGMALGEGRAAMMFDADIVAYFQNIPGFSREAGNIAWVPPPVLNKGDTPKSNMWIWSMSMHSESRRKQSAWLFMQYFTSKEFQLWAAVEENCVNPPRNSVFNDPAMQDKLALAQGYVETLNTLIDESGIQFTPRKDVMEYTGLWAETVQRMTLEGLGNVSNELENLKKQIDLISNDNRE